jgi:chromate transporter
MNVLLLYLLLLKATLTSFSGLTSLPMVRDDLVIRRHVITDRDLNAAVAVGRTTPGPIGLYLVSVGYFAAGWPGALAGALALMTPAFLIVPLLRYLGRRAGNPRVRGAIEAVTLAAAGLVASIAIPLARDAVTGWLPAAIAAASFAVLAFTNRDTLWVIAGSALAGFAASFIR